MKLLKLYIILILVSFPILRSEAQDAKVKIDKAYTLIDKEEYAKAYKILQGVEEHQAEEFGDSCVMMYNYEVGSCLYFMDQYEDAIPYLNKALLKMEKFPHEDCIYLELIYGIGSCYNSLKQYENAEKYFRRVIIRGNMQDFKCSITTQTLSELTEVYSKLGYDKLADQCTAKISSKVDGLSGNDWEHTVDGLLDLANSYELQNNLAEEINTYRKILSIIESNVGKTNEDYLLYAHLFRSRLYLTNNYDEAIPVSEEIINIGKSLKTHYPYICSTYEDYLRMMAFKNDIETVNKTLPEAISYMKNTPDFDWEKHNLYEIIGNGFFSAKNYEIGVQWLEKEWNGHRANSILSLTNMGSYYYKSNPQKALHYFKEAEKQEGNAANDETREFIYENIMFLHANLEEHGEAAKYAEKTAPYLKNMKDENYYVRFLVNWAIECQKANQEQKSDSIFREIESLLDEVSNETKAAVYSNRGFVLILQKKYSECINVLSKGVVFAETELGNGNILLSTMYHNMGRAYMLLEDYKTALENLNKSKNLQIQENCEAMPRTLQYIKECEGK